MNKGPGRGKRVCKGCGAVIGARTIKCKCGVSKASTSAARGVLKVEQEVVTVKPETLVRVPSGSPPIKWMGLKRSSVIEWIEATILYGKSDFKIYSEEAILYFLGLTLGIHSKGYKKCSKYIKVYFEHLEESSNVEVP